MSIMDHIRYIKNLSERIQDAVDEQYSDAKAEVIREGHERFSSNLDYAAFGLTHDFIVNASAEEVGQKLKDFYKECFEDDMGVDLEDYR